VSAEGHEIIYLLTNDEDPVLGETNSPSRSYQNDVWRINQAMATRDLATVADCSSGLLKKGKQSHKVKEHPAAYPAELPRAVITFLTAPGEIVFDPFCGSGTTIIAAEQLGRRCYAIEISPAYCDVAVRRWEEFTGQKATRIEEQG